MRMVQTRRTGNIFRAKKGPIFDNADKILYNLIWHSSTLSAMREREEEQDKDKEGSKWGGEIYPFWGELLDTHFVSLSTLSLVSETHSLSLTAK